MNIELCSHKIEFIAKISGRAKNKFCAHTLHNKLKDIEAIFSQSSVNFGLSF